MGRQGETPESKAAVKQLARYVEDFARKNQQLLNERPSDISRDMWLAAMMMNFFDARIGLLFEDLRRWLDEVPQPEVDDERVQ